ncbi:virulence RhuM family protein [Candidatus Saccharibacteria bacterium oral taxon 955]|nr:virulence RhuM family protein [Candidatus Saccharibacteria bacterium oral taxon 955]
MTRDSGNVIVYVDDNGKPQVDVRFQDETVWLTQAQLVDLYQSSKANVSEHIKNIFDEGELDKDSVVRKFRTTASDGKNYEVNYYNLDMIISLGYRIKSSIATKFRIWATDRLREYITKGFAIDSERLKNLDGGNHWKELLDEIRDIRSSEKVLYRQVLDLYATAEDYDPKADQSQKFFVIVQNKLHYAAHGNTASEVIYYRVDSDKPFIGMTNFKGKQPTQAEAMVAKNYLSQKELKVLNNLVSAYFDIAEINAMEEKPMCMADHLRELDTILSSTGRNLLDNAGKISTKQAKEKALAEYRKYKAKNLSGVEEDYLRGLRMLRKNLKEKLV